MEQGWQYQLMSEAREGAVLPLNHARSLYLIVLASIESLVEKHRLSVWTNRGMGHAESGISLSTKKGFTCLFSDLTRHNVRP